MREEVALELTRDQSCQIRTLIGQIAALESRVADYHQLALENKALRKRSDWLEGRVSELETRWAAMFV